MPDKADIELALSNLIDDRDFIEIDRRRAKFNLFEAMGSVRAELRHSNFLAFLLSPARSHGLGPKPLQLVLKAILTKLPAAARPIPLLEVAVGDLDDATVFREVDYIDLLIEIRELNLIVVIENKVDAQAGDGQLERYKRAVDTKYSKWRKLYVFLTPDGRDPDHSEYVAFSYIELSQIIEDMVSESTHVYGQDVVLILNHYVELLRRNIVDDEALRSLALKIYERHADAIDFILSCKPEPTSLLPVARALVEQDSAFSEDKHSPTIFRFFPTEWSNEPAVNGGFKDRWTKTGRNLLFEIKSFKAEGEYSDRILLSLVLGPCELDLRRYLFDGARAHPDVFAGCGKSIGQSWVTIFSRELLSEAAAENMELPEKEGTITKNWKQFLERDLPGIKQAVVTLTTSAPVKPAFAQRDQLIPGT